MPPKHNKAASSTTWQTRSVTRAGNSAARPATPNREDVSPRPSIVPSNSLVRPATQNRDDVIPPRPNSALSSRYEATPNIRTFRRAASPAGAHNGLASRYVPTPPNFLDSRRARSPGVVHHSAFSFRHSSPPLISTNLAEMQNAFSFRPTASPLNGSYSRPASSPPRMYNGMQASHLVSTSPNFNHARHPISRPRFHNARLASHTASTQPNVSASLHATIPRLDDTIVSIPVLGRPPLRFRSAMFASPPVPTPLNDRSPIRFHSARPSYPPGHVPTPLNSMSSRFHIARPSSPPVPTPLNDRSPLRFHSPMLYSPPVPTPLNDRSPLRFHRPLLSSPPVPTPLNGISPRFRYARLARPSSPLVPTPRNSRCPPRVLNTSLAFYRPSSPHRFRNALASRYVVTPPGSQTGLTSSSVRESGPRRMASGPATRREANSSRQHNTFNITVDLTDSPLAAAPHLNATVDLTDSPFNAPIPPMDNTVGASLPMENSPAATPGTSPIRCPVCLDGHARITSTGRSLMSTVCGHIFCSACLPVCIRSSGRCPTCRSVIRPHNVHPVYI